MVNNNSERIEVLKNILEKLHLGASQESVQEEFEKHFSNVNAIEISLMEQEIINDPNNDLSFEDVLKLCNVHARLFQNKVEAPDVFGIDNKDHPVYIFKQENIALRKTILRVDNIINYLISNPNSINQEMISGLKRQVSMLGEVSKHYERKEKVFFPFLEKYGHYAPPKVMWAKDDMILELFNEFKLNVDKLPEIDLKILENSYHIFKEELNEMIFKEEAILLNLLLETLKPEDWEEIKEESYAYGYAIIKPEKSDDDDKKSKHKFDIEATQSMQGPKDRIDGRAEDKLIETRKIELDNAYITITYEAKESKNLLTESASRRFRGGNMSLDEARVILQNLDYIVALYDQDLCLKYINQESVFFSKNDIGSSIENLLSSSIYKNRISNSNLLRVRNKEGEKEEFRICYRQKNYNLILQSIYTEEKDFLGMILLILPIDKYNNLEKPSKREISLEEDNSIKKPVIKSASEFLPENKLTREKNLEVDFTAGVFSGKWQEKVAKVPDLQMEIGKLSLTEVDALLLALPAELTFVDTNRVFRYFNCQETLDKMIFKRTNAQIGRNIEYCHPPKLWPRVKLLFEQFENGIKDKEEMWYENQEGKTIFITYKALIDDAGAFRGVLESVEDVTKYIGNQE